MVYIISIDLCLIYKHLSISAEAKTGTGADSVSASDNVFATAV